MDAFDADVLIYAATQGHPLGQPVRALLRHDLGGPTDAAVGIGSVLLVPEMLSKPIRVGAVTELEELERVLSRLELVPTDLHTAALAATLGASYRLRAADAVHLATAVAAGADRFVTNNTKDFPKSITEVEITYPGDLT